MKLFKRKDKKLCKVCEERIAVTKVTHTAPGNKRARSTHYVHLRDHDMCMQCWRRHMDWKRSFDLKVHEDAYMTMNMDLFSLAREVAAL